jgi:hypothetical protein
MLSQRFRDQENPLGPTWGVRSGSTTGHQTSADAGRTYGRIRLIWEAWVRAVIATPAQLEGFSRSSELRG